MPPAASTTVMIVLALLVLAGMRVGWRRRATRDSAVVPELPAVPAADDPALGAPRTAPLEATYVSSTTAGDWLDRVVALDLGVRSAAVVQVFDAGVRIGRTGARDLFLPAAAVQQVRRAPGMAGKFVGRDALVVLTWRPPGTATTALDTGLHLRHAADRVLLTEAVRALTGQPADTDPASTQPASTDPVSTQPASTEDLDVPSEERP